MFKKNRIIIVLLVSIFLNIIVLGFLMFDLYFRDIPFAKYLSKVFLNKEGFNASSATAVIALIGVLITIYTHYSSIRANIISKERTRWLQNNKTVMAEYLVESHTLSQTLRKHKVTEEDLNNLGKDNPLYDEKLKQNVKYFEEIENLSKNLAIKYQLLKLDLSDDDGKNQENKNFLDSIEVVYVNVSRIFNKSKQEIYSYDFDFTELNESLLELSNEANKYYKSVWKQIKAIS